MTRVALISIVASACVGPLGPREPAMHRAEGVTCETERPTWEVKSLSDNEGYYGYPSSCEAHEDCTDGDEGRCTEMSSRGGRFLACTYSECETDADCAGGVCRCGGEAFDSHSVCLPAGNCQTDDDCGNDYCSLSYTSCGPDWGDVLGHFCHTTFDGCRDDADCGGDDSDGYCAYDEGAGRWMCMESFCVG